MRCLLPLPSTYFHSHLYAGMLNLLIRYIYLDTDSANDWCLRETAQKHGKAIVDLIHEHVDSVSRSVCFQLVSTCALLFTRKVFFFFDNQITDFPPAHDE